ncbi:glycyl-radical enzyme activating protein [Microbacter margulisiae]|uniref:Pyruvate formate lyase activating enzyme n=1 Tax=Microbacter margulisiae TaxID=1350067 RepID=A0A7W5DRC8_9PORP|nr:glycyl-radical enzyme activating protein [Microbacter margulisiae]MBB3187675.1 pyruvate formate lyase activating enzyme [Microbacter margulisiae]
MGIIFDIKRFAVHDGPGIRTTVFMKGCPLSCIWCHNPESINGDICTVPKTIRIGQKTFIENETAGNNMSVETLMKELLKEKIFMDESGGGVTFSGGEPMLQHLFLNEALAACKAHGMHTAVDTSGYAQWNWFEETMQWTDLFLYDLKLMDEEQHRKYTGVSNKTILENLKQLLSIGKKVRVRVPMVPEITHTEGNIEKIIRFLSSIPNRPESVDLLPYHNTATHKYERFGIMNMLTGVKSMNKSDLEATKQRFEEAGFDVKIGG